MVRWYHAIFTAYGFWLPNDPRGSWSTFVGSWELFKFAGAATKTDDRRSVAHQPHDTALRREAKQHLKYPVVRFDEQERHCIADGIAQACTESAIGLLACAIGFDHVHSVLERHQKTAEQIVQHFKGRATKHLTRAGLHPLRGFARRNGTTPSPWAEGCWHVFINDEKQLSAAINYVNRHPEKEGLPPQNWPFVLAVQPAGLARRSYSTNPRRAWPAG
jgi:REP element-mobilizing transposase RayT